VVFKSTTVHCLDWEVSKTQKRHGFKSLTFPFYTLVSVLMTLKVIKEEYFVHLIFIFFLGFDVIAKCLARIEKNIQDIQTKQNFILETLLPGQNNIVDVTAITNEIRLPCASISDIGNLEKWLQLKENEARLVIYFYYYSFAWLTTHGS